MIIEISIIRGTKCGVQSVPGRVPGEAIVFRVAAPKCQKFRNKSEMETNSL